LFLRTNTYRTPVTSALQLTGDLTVQFLLRTRYNVLSGLSSDNTVISCSPVSSGETEARNWLYSLRLGNESGWKYYHESGDGVDSGCEWQIAPLAGKTQLISLVREAGDVTLYVDGQSWGTQTVGSPTGGTEGILCIGPTPGTGVIGSLRVENRARNATENRIDYNWTLGRYYGRLAV
jgi:hypothetical protein